MQPRPTPANNSQQQKQQATQNSLAPTFGQWSYKATGRGQDGFYRHKSTLPVRWQDNDYTFELTDPTAHSTEYHKFAEHRGIPLNQEPKAPPSDSLAFKLCHNLQIDKNNANAIDDETGHAQCSTCLDSNFQPRIVACCEQCKFFVCITCFFSVLSQPECPTCKVKYKKDQVLYLVRLAKEHNIKIGQVFTKLVQKEFKPSQATAKPKPKPKPGTTTAPTIQQQSLGWAR